MSSWNKASKAFQKHHKERGQLKERENVGFLEKKKDYKLRAIDYQNKTQTLKNLKRKAQERNKDEFYFNMTRTRMKDGVHQLRDAFKDYTEDEIKLMKTQDKNYIQMHQQIERNKIEKLKNSTHLLDIGEKPSNVHRFFVDDVKELREFDPVKQFNTHELLMNRKTNRLTVDQLKNLKLADSKDVDEQFLKEMAKKRKKKYNEISQRVKRLDSLKKLERSYDLKPKKVDPEQEYDVKYHLNESESSTSVQQLKNKNILPRKR